MDLEIRIKPQGRVLEEYYQDRDRCSFIMGPLGSGKTIQTILKILKLMTEQSPNAEDIRPSRWYAIRNTYPDLMTTTVKDWLEVFEDLGRFTQGSKEPPHQKIYFDLEDGTSVKSEIIFLAMDRDEHVKKLRGAQATGFWLNECKELPKSVVDMADLRHGRYPTKAAGGVKCDWHGMLGDTNAPDDDSWYYKAAEEEALEDWTFHRQPGGVVRIKDKWEINPVAENVGNLPEGEQYYIKGMQGKSYDWINTNLANNYGSLFDGKAVYEDFNSQIHVADIHPIKAPLLLGWDFGLTPACIIGQISPSGQLLIHHTILAERAGIKQFGINVIRPLLQKEYPGYFIGHSAGDPAGSQGAQTDEKTCLEVLSDDYNPRDPMSGGVGIITYPAHTNALEARTGAVSGFLTRLIDGYPAILIHPRCKLLIKGFNGGYCYEKVQVSGSERYKETPKKNKYSHPHDALQYLVLSVVTGEALEYQAEEEYDDDYSDQVSTVTGY